MANTYGALIAQHVIQTTISIGTAAWVPLQVGSAPLNNRRHVKIQLRSEVGAALALEYANGEITTGPSGSQQIAFTAPTASGGNSTLLIGETTNWEPVGDKVTIYGRLVNKAGASENSIKVIVTEYA